MERDLISMTAFVLWIRSMTTSELQKEIPKRFPKIEWQGNTQVAAMDFLAHDARKWSLTGNYAKFLKKPLSLGMFIPCDLDGNVLEDKGECSCGGNPEHCHGCNSYHYHNDTFKESDVYQEALDRVVFEGFRTYDNYGDDCIFNDELRLRKEVGQLSSSKVEDLVGKGLKIKENHWNKLIG